MTGKISSNQIYLNHHPEGGNIVGGITDIVAGNQGALLNIRETRELSVLVNPIVVHFRSCLSVAEQRLLFLATLEQ